MDFHKQIFIIIHAIVAYGLIFILTRSFVSKIKCFAISSKNERLHLDLCTRIVSLANVFVCMVATVHLALSDFVVTFQNLESAAFESNTTRDVYLLLISGYMLYDVCILIFWWHTVGDWVMLLHHLVAIIAINVGVQFQAATFYMAALLVNEFSTIFLNIRYFLLYMGRQDDRSYALNGLLLAISFFLSRICVITVFVAHAVVAWWKLAFVQGLYWSRPSSDRVLFIGLTILLSLHFIVNIYWFEKIVAHARRRFNWLGIKTSTVKHPDHVVKLD